MDIATIKAAHTMETFGSSAYATWNSLQGYVGYGQV